MWMYSGLDDTTRIHPEEVDDDTLEGWLSGITRNKDNPRGARRVPPFDQSHVPEKVRFRAFDCNLNSLAQLSIPLRLTLLFLLSFRPLSKCIQCPMERKSRIWKERRAAATVANGLLTMKGTEKATTQVTKKKSSRLLAGRGDPSLTKNDRAPAKGDCPGWSVFKASSDLFTNPDRESAQAPQSCGAENPEGVAED